MLPNLTGPQLGKHAARPLIHGPRRFGFAFDMHLVNFKPRARGPMVFIVLAVRDAGGHADSVCG